MEHAIQIRGLAKTYRGGVQALKGVDLQVRKGSVFGLLGPNGAGKSTLIKCLLSIVRPTAGSATLLGQPISSPLARAKVGYLPEGHRFPQYLTAAGVCRYFGGLSGLHGEELEREVQSKLELVGLSEWADKRVNKFSKGMAQRVGVAQAFLGDPEIVFLDEPTDGVDPVNRQGLHFVIRNAVEKGATVFINSHLLPELEVLCDEVGILNQGEMLRQGLLLQCQRSVTSGQEPILYAIIGPYANSYSGYIVTPFEYLEQEYEAGSTLYGRWTLAAWQTALRQVVDQLGLEQSQPSTALDVAPGESVRG